MADLADVANDRILLELDQRLAVRRSALPGRVEEECEECAVVIPFERVQALAKLECLRCVDCQRVHEQRLVGQARGSVVYG